LTADTSAVIAGLSAWHEQHEVAAALLEGVTTIPAHVFVEAYSVLTRLPSGLAVPATAAATALTRRFPQTPLTIGARERRLLLETLAAAGVFGGATYDGLVALEASAHGETLLTLDERAQITYQRVGAPFSVIAP
jgi:predicted nucleic acid-binding protein